MSPRVPVEGADNGGGRKAPVSSSVAGFPLPGSGAGGGLGQSSGKEPHSLCALAPPCSENPSAHTLASVDIKSNSNCHDGAS